MNFLTKFSMKSAAVIILIALMILGGGIYSAKQMKSEALPDIEVPVIWMTAVYPGAGPNDVSREVTEPLEKALQGVDGVKNITSYSMQNAGTVVLEYDLNADMDKAEQEINSALTKAELPESVKKPELHKASVNDPNIMSFCLAANTSQAEAAQYVKDVLKPSLSKIEGVEEISLEGESEKKIFVRLLPEKLTKYGVSADSVKQALNGVNITIPAGEVTMADQIMPIEIKRELNSIDDLRAMPLFTVDQSSMMKKAFGAVSDGFQTMGKAVQQGFVQLGEAQKGQMQLLGNLQLLSAAINGEQQELSKLLAIPNPDSVTAGKIAALQKDLAIKQGQYQQLSGRLQGVMTSISKASAPRRSSSGSSGKSSISSTPAIKTLKLGDVAEISYGFEKGSSLVRVNGKEGVVFNVARQNGGNVVEISDQVHQELNKVNLPQGYEVTELFDYAGPIKESVSSMVREGLLGALFAVLVTFLFLRNLRATLVSIVSIPISVLAAMIVLNKMGYTINVMTLSGIAVAVGRVVDDSIVVIENVYRRLRGAREKDQELVYEATAEVSSAITSSTLTTIAVFGPMAFVSGIVGKVFAPFAITVVIALAFSLLVAVTVVPLLSRIFLLKLKPVEEKENMIQSYYGRALNWSLGHKTIVLIAAIGVLAGSFALVPRLGTSFLPQDVVRYYKVSVTMPVGTSLEKTDLLTRQAEQVALAEKDVDIYQSTVNSDGKAGIFIRIKESCADPKAVADHIRTKLEKIKGARDINIQELGGPGGSPMFSVEVKGNDYNNIKLAGKQITDALKRVPGLTDISNNLEDVKPQVVIRVDEVKAAQKGLNPLMVGGMLREMITGSKVTSMIIDGKEQDLEVSFKTGDITNIDKINNLEVMSVTGSRVKIRDIARVAQEPGPTSIQRKNMTQFATVEGLITAANSGQVSRDAEAKIKTLKLPEGVYWNMEGNSKMMDEGFRDMGIAMGVAVVLVFVVMIGAFGNAMAPLSILFSLPLALIGALLGLLVTGEPIGMPALIGGLMLIGIVVTNAIVLVDRVEQQRKQGLEVHDALIEAGKTRIRPIFMTAIATIGALVPLAVTPAEGALISKSMAVVVIGGLTTSTVLTLIVVPVVYNILNTITAKIFKTGVNPEVKRNQGKLEGKYLTKSLSENRI